MLGLQEAWALVGQVVALAHIEIEMDRIQRYDGRQQRASPASPPRDQVADRDAVAADAPGQRCGIRVNLMRWTTPDGIDVPSSGR